MQLHLADPTATERLGATLACRCPIPSVIYLVGDLGTGKTTLSRGFLRALGFGGRVKSPTYTLLEPYEFDGFGVLHLDLYRLAAAEEFEFLGVREYLHGPAICLIEWPERGGDLLPPADLTVELTQRAEQRLARIRPASQAWKLALTELPLGCEGRR